MTVMRSHDINLVQIVSVVFAGLSESEMSNEDEGVKLRHEEFKIWKKNTPFLYGAKTRHSLWR